MLTMAAMASLQVAEGAAATRIYESPAERAYVEPPYHRSGTVRWFWIIHQFTRPHRDGAASARDQWVMDCSTLSFSMIAVVRYDRRGKIIKVEAVPEQNRVWSPILPGSPMIAVARAVC